MTFTPKTWQNGQAGGTPLNATGLNDLEGRIDTGIASVESAIEGIVVNVRQFGAVLDDVADDTTECQAAIDFVGQNGGGVVEWDGPCFIDTLTTAGGISWLLLNRYDNVELRFRPGSKLRSTQNAIYIASMGGAKPAGGASWANYWLGDATKATYYAMSPAARAARSITLTTPAQASNFAVGDYIYIRTGQLIAAHAPGDTEPDAEINQVTSVDAGTGVLGLRWPTGKPYAQEYYISGTSGFTSTAVTANLAVFGVAKVTDRIIQNFKITGQLELDALSVTSGHGVISCFGVDGLEITGLRGRSGGNVVNNIECRRVRFADWDGESVYAASGTYKWAFAFGTGCADGDVDDVKWTGSGSKMLVFHVHEGSADVTIRNSRCVSPAGTADNAPLSVRARSYGFMCKDTTFITEANNYAAYVSPACVAGGMLENVKAICLADSTKGIWIDTGATGWEIRRPDPATKVRGLDAFKPRRPHWSPTPDNGLLAATFDPALATIAGAIGTGFILVNRIFIPYTMTISSLEYYVTIAGSGLTAGQNLVGIYSSAGTLLGKSATQESAGAVATNLHNAASSPSTTLTAEAGQSLTVEGGPDKWVYSAMLFVGTTTPTLARQTVPANLLNRGCDATTGFRAAASTAGSQTSLPSTLPAITASTFLPWVGLA